MRDAGRRPWGRLCCWVVCGIVACAFWPPADLAQSGPPTTTVTDTVYQADGTVAHGTMIIVWPAFQTAGGAQVTEGTTNVTLASNGTFSVALVPNVGATPAGVYYTVVFQLGPGEVRTEYWVVPTTSPANLSQVRTTPGSGVAGQPVSLQYVNSALATKANDSAVVHLAGTETINGTKTFSAAPNVPTPTSSGQVASKGYVDQAVSNVGAGNFLPTAGGTMTGPITLPGGPSAPLQAATKQYVDTGLAAKADLISGLVPTSELGTGQATGNNCLLGNGTWGPCAAGGTGNLSTTPTTNQTIAQPAGTQFAANNLANIRYVTMSWNWAQTPADNLLTPGNLTIHLSPCPLGIDTTSSSNNYVYKVYISGRGTPEAVTVTGGNCTPGATSGTIAVTTANSHAAGYTVGSASSGIQEAWNDAWTSDVPGTATSIASPYVKLMAGTNYAVFATIYLRGRGGMLDGAGAYVVCSTRDRCVYVGTPTSAIGYHKLYNLTAGSTLNVDGVQVGSVSAVNGTYTVTTGSSHPFVVGDIAACEYHSQTADQRWVSPVTSVPNATTFTVSFRSATFSAGANTFGFCNILNTFLENGSDHVTLQDINITQANPSAMGTFSYGITNDNDQQFIVERGANRSTGSIKNSPNWPLGAFFYQRTDQGNAGIMYVHDTELTNVNCADGGGNGFVMTDTVCQGFPVFGVRYFGGLQPSTFQNVYQESTGATGNPLYAGAIASQMGILVQGGTGHRILGTFPISGWTPVFASGGTTQRNYFVVPRSSTQGYGPMWFIGSAQPTNGSVSINLQWPSIELQDAFFHSSLGTLTWDILVTTGTSAISPAPYGTGNFAVATNVSGSCTTAGMCSFTDTQAAPSSYTVQTTQGFTPVFWFWPSNIAVNNTVIFEDVGATAPGVVATQGTGSVAVVASQCQSQGVGYQRSPVVISCGTINNAFHATIWPGLNGTPANSKGRFNFGAYQNAPNDFITLYDSNFSKTTATVGERPAGDAGDTALGADQAGGLSQRAAASITSYINALPSGTNYQERLTATGKTFNVPVTVNGGLAVSGGNVTLPITGSGTQCLHVSAAGVVSGAGADCGSGGSGSGIVNSGSTSQLAVYSGTGAAVSGDSSLTDNGTTLNYGGIGGIAATAGTFSGNLTVNGQLLVAGPWTVSSPIPGTATGPAGPGTSSLGVSNDGNFYISQNGGTPQKVATTATSSFFSNLFQEDANDLGMFNGTNGQGLHIYGTYTNASNYERTGLGWDATDNYFVMRNENAGTGNQRGIGFWIGSGIRWGIDTASAFKPFQNNAFDIGVVSPSSLVPRTVYAGTSFDTLTQGRLNFELCNDGTTGTSLNFLAVYNGASPACAVKAGISNTDGVIGIVSNGSGTSGNAVITYRGYASCSFDGGTTAGDYVVASITNPGDCHDAGLIRPTAVQVLGRVESTNTGVGTYGVRVSLDAPNTGTFLDASLQAGSTLDVKLNNANALAITSGSTTIDARAMGGAQTIASEVSIGELRPPAITAVSGASPGAGTYKLVYTLTSPTATETSASMESTVTVTGSQAIQVTSPTYFGTANSYSVYMTSVGAAGLGTVNTLGTVVTWASGQQFTTGSGWNGQAIFINGAQFTISSVADATHLTINAGAGTQTGVGYSTGNWSELKCASATNVAIGTNVTISAACSGPAVSTLNKGFAVALIPPHTGVWTTTIADSVPNTSCGLRFFDQSSLLGDGAGEGRPWYLVSTPSTNVEALVCTDNNPKQGAGYYSIRGLAAHGISSDAIQTATCVIYGPFDVSVFDDLQCVTNQSYPAALVYANGTGASTRISGSFEANSAGQPLVIGALYTSIGDIDFRDISAVHPGNSYPNIAIRAGAMAIHFSGTTYMEGPATGSCASPIQIGTQNNVAGPVIFDSVHHGAWCAGTTATMFSVPSSFWVNNLTVGPVYMGNFTNMFNYAPNTALNISGAGTFTTHPGFTLDINNPRMVLTNFQVVGTTTLGTTTATTPATSDNSTNVATTAFVKNQGYATLASPALTGTPTAPTASAGDNSTKIATTAYVDGNYLPTSLAWGHNFNTTTTVPFNTSTGHMNVFGIFVSQPVKASQITVYVVTADNSANTYDVGLFAGVSGSSNNLIAHTGAVAGSTYFATAASFTTIPFGSTVILQPGRYYLGLYANEASAPLALASNASSDVEFYHFNAATITPASGGLPAAFTGPTDVYTTSAAPVFVLH